MRMPVEVGLVAFLHLCFYRSAASFQARYVSHSVRDLPKNGRRGHHGRLRVYRLWTLACVLASLPGVTYSVMKAVPGFLQ
eukprot:3305537-Amphidinium_carterae.1